MIQRTLEMQFDKLIIGADQRALSYALDGKYPLLFCRRKPPSRFDIEPGDQKIDYYYNTLYELAKNNQLPFSDLPHNLRIDENVIKVITKNNLIISVRYKDLVISDDYNIEGLPPPVGKTEYKNLVVDYIRVSSGKNPLILQIDTPDMFVNKVYFYKSKIDPFDVDRLDIAAVSIIEDENLDLFEYSEVSSKMKIKRLMKENNFKGRWDKTNEIFKPVVLFSDKRVVTPIGKNIYSSLPNNIEMLY